MERVYSGTRWVDQGHGTAAANTVSREIFGHVNVDNVDTSGPGVRDSLLDGAIQAVVASLIRVRFANRLALTGSDSRGSDES